MVIGVVFLTFLLQQILPGGPCAASLGTHATPQACRAFNHENGLDRPLIMQFFSYLWNAAQLQLGASVRQGTDVWFLIKGAMNHSITLILASIFINFLIAIPLGLAQAQRRNTKFDYIATGVSFLLYATPAFLVGTILISVLAIRYSWIWPHFPFRIMPESGALDVFLHPVQFILPVITLSALSIGGLARYQRSALLDTLTMDYIRTAKAKGASQRRVIYRHALRNSLLPIITIVGLSLPGIVGGALITETLYGYPGMGMLSVSAAQNDDIIVVMGVTMIASALTVIGSIVADVLYAFADPRIRLGAAN